MLFLKLWLGLWTKVIETTGRLTGNTVETFPSMNKRSEPQKEVKNMKRKHSTEKDFQIAKTLLGLGMSQAKIGEALGKSASLVCLWDKCEGWKDYEAMKKAMKEKAHFKKGGIEIKKEHNRELNNFIVKHEDYAQK